MNQKNQERKAASVRLWDLMAPDFVREPPSFDSDPFLSFMERKAAPEKDHKVFDLGCGTGTYSLALSGRVKSVLGTDFSPEMIRLAREQAEKHGAGNLSFMRLDWDEADIDALGFRGAFDIAFAHMTPALSGREGLLKLLDCSRVHCFIARPLRRDDPILTHARELAGIEAPETGGPDLWAVLRDRGLEWESVTLDRYREEQLPVEKAADRYVSRVAAKTELSPERAEAINAYVRSLAQEGLVRVFVETTVEYIYCKVR